MLSTLFSFSGRIPRKTFWLAMLALLVIILAIYAAAISVLGFPAMNPNQPPDFSHPIFKVYGVVTLLSIWPALAIYVKRLHDRNMSGWWIVAGYLLMLIPFGLMFMNPAMMAGMQAGQMPSGAGVMMAVMMGAYLVASLLFLWLFIVTGFLRGTNGPNRFGPDPLGGTGSDAPPPGHDWAN